MKNLLLGLLLLLASLTQAEAQCTGVFGAATICGNPSSTPGAPKAVASSTVSFGTSITAYGATCSGGGGDNTAAIQAAMDAVPEGGTLHIPACPTSGQVYALVGSGTCILTRTTPINIVGDGLAGSILFLSSSVPNTRDVFCINPAVSSIGYSFRDFGIVFSTAGRHAIHFNVPLGVLIYDNTIERMRINTSLGGHSVHVTNDPSTGSGGFAYSQIQFSNLESIYLDTVGDGLTIQGNIIGATGTNAAIRTSFVAGAGGFTINGNVITSLNGHILVVDGNGVVIQNNYLETPVGIANTYGFLVDIGTSASGMLSPQLVSNQYSVLAGTSNPIPVRIRNNVNNARLADMRYFNQSGNQVQIDAGAVDTRFDRNAHCLTANVVVACAISNAGTTSGWVQSLALGTVSVPGLAFLGDPNTGIYSPGADKVAVTAGGVETARFGAGLSVGTTTDPGAGVVIAQTGFSVNTAGGTLFLKQGANGSVGTFVCTGGGTITINNNTLTITDNIIISLNTVGGTITTPPAMKALTASTSFQVLCGATDTSTYNYAIIRNF